MNWSLKLFRFSSFRGAQTVPITFAKNMLPFPFACHSEPRSGEESGFSARTWCEILRCAQDDNFALRMTISTHIGMTGKRAVGDGAFIPDPHDHSVDRLVLRLSRLTGRAAAADEHDVARSRLHCIDRDDEGILQGIIQPDVFHDLEFQADEFFVFSRSPDRSDNLTEKHSAALFDGIYGLRHSLVTSRTGRA